MMVCSVRSQKPQVMFVRGRAHTQPQPGTEGYGSEIEPFSFLK
jgi:hypothetical protein